MYYMSRTIYGNTLSLNVFKGSFKRLLTYIKMFVTTYFTTKILRFVFSLKRNELFQLIDYMNENAYMSPGLGAGGRCQFSIFLVNFN